MSEDTEIRIRKAWYKSTRLWVYGSVSTFIGGGASSIAAIVIDPLKFNLNDGLANIGKMFLVSGIISLMAHIAKSPMPSIPDEDK